MLAKYHLNDVIKNCEDLMISIDYKQLIHIISNKIMPFFNEYFNYLII